MKKLTFVFCMIFSSGLALADLMEDFDSLGGNSDLYDKAQALSPEKRISVVQKRIVDRSWRHEFSPEYINTVGGDPYLESHSAGFTYHLHFNPRFSMGLSYQKYYNSLSSEGELIIDDLEFIPDVDHPNEAAILSARLYPFYGKMSLFGRRIVQFDTYMMLGAGNITLESGPTETYLVGPGFGIWFSQHVSFRTEIYYQNYQSQRKTGETDMDITQVKMSVGLML